MIRRIRVISVPLNECGLRKLGTASRTSKCEPKTLRARSSNINRLIRGHIANRPARMPGVVMRPRDVFARLQFDAQGGQRVNFGQDAGARLEIERTAFALDSRVEEFIADLGQP